MVPISNLIQSQRLNTEYVPDVSQLSHSSIRFSQMHGAKMSEVASNRPNLSLEGKWNQIQNDDSAIIEPEDWTHLPEANQFLEKMVQN